jgi:hypothetical protein
LDAQLFLFNEWINGKSAWETYQKIKAQRPNHQIAECEVEQWFMRFTSRKIDIGLKRRLFEKIDNQEAKISEWPNPDAPGENLFMDPSGRFVLLAASVRFSSRVQAIDLLTGRKK